MARRRSRGRTGQRDDYSIPSLLLDDVIRPVVFESPPRRHLWAEVEDRRHWHPDGDFQDADDFGGVPARVVYDDLIAESRPMGTPPRGRSSFGSRPRFFAPESVVVCARRKERREVLFARRRTGKGARGRRHRNWMTEVSCK